METSSLQTFLSTSEEIEEPRSKKIKIDRNHLSSDDEQQQNLYYTDKKTTNKYLNFPEVLWNFNQNSLELQKENTADLNNARQFAHFKQCMNANLQSRLLGNMPFYEILTLDCSNCIIRDTSSEFNENKNLVTKSEFWALNTKERSKSIDSGIILKRNELPTVNTIFYNIMVENLNKTIESLFKNVPDFQSNENGEYCHHVCKMFKSEEKYHTPKPVADGENIRGKTSCLGLLASCLMKENKSELECLFCENKNIVVEDADFCKKPTRLSASKHSRRNKSSQHIYMPFSRICVTRNSKLVRYTAFKLQDKIPQNSGIASKKNDISVFSQGHLFNIQQRGLSKESRTKECLIFSKNTIENYFDSVSGNEKDQMSKQCLFSIKKISSESNVPNSALWEKQLWNPKKLQDLRGNFKHLNCLSSKNISEKLNIKYSSLQMVVTVGTCLQEKKIKPFSKNIVFPIKKQQTSHLILRTSKKHRTRTLRNNINLAHKTKYVQKYLRSCGRAAINKNKYGICKDFQEHSCVFIDTYRKIYLNTDSEEVYLISFLKNVILNDKNNEKSRKGCTVADTRLNFSVLDTLINIFVPPALITNVTNSNSFLVQEKKNKKPQYLEYINSHWSKYEINDTAFPSKCLNSGNKHLSDNDQCFISTFSCQLCKDQNLAVSVKAWHSEIALHGNRGKQSDFVFGNIKVVLQYQPKCHYRHSKYLKYPKIKKVGYENFLLKKYLLPGSIHSSELESVKQNDEDVNKIENEGVAQSYTSTSYQNVDVPYAKDESARYIESKVNGMVVSCTQKEQHFEHTIKEHFATKLKGRYEFEMKNQFNLVLEELCMFNEIEKKNGTNLLCGKINLQEDPVEHNHSDSILGEDSRNICESTTLTTCSTTPMFSKAVTQKGNRESLLKDIPVLITQTGKQEALHYFKPSNISDEELFCSPSEEHCDSGCKQLSTWKPAFVYHALPKKERYSFQNERGNCLFDAMLRVQPLKTCPGPLRIGLSRKAKLRRLHPYLK